MYKFIGAFVFLAITACSSSTDTQSSQEVNLLGVWDFQMTSQNFVCDGFEARGIWTFNSLNGDTSIIGDVQIQGEGFSDDGFGNCVYITVDETITTSSGNPSTVTRAELQKELNTESENDNSVVTETITSFSDTRIVFVLEATNGIILTTVITR